MQYNPPAELTQGDTDMVPASLTPGELVVTKPSAEQYSPEVKQAINDPAMAAEINAMIEAFLSDDTANPVADESDDGNGLGVMNNLGSPSSAIPRPRSGLANVTRI
jgi:hypothetical protein